MKIAKYLISACLFISSNAFADVYINVSPGDDMSSGNTIEAAYKICTITSNDASGTTCDSNLKITDALPVKGTNWYVPEASNLASNQKVVIYNVSVFYPKKMYSQFIINFPTTEQGITTCASQGNQINLKESELSQTVTCNQ